MQVNTLQTKLVNMIFQSRTVRKILCGVRCSLYGDNLSPSLAFFILKQGNMVKQMFCVTHTRARACNVKMIAVTLYTACSFCVCILAFL
jgi:hypothetical protein